MSPTAPSQPAGTSTSATTPAAGRFPVWVQFLLLALAWGSSFLFIKIGLEILTPGQVVLGRLVSGALVLLAICAVGGAPLPRGRGLLGHLLVVALLLCVVPFLLYSWAEQRIASGMASIFNATTPLMTMLVSLVALPGEPRTRERYLGLGLGFAGVLTLVEPWKGVAGTGLWGSLACLGATACYGLGFTWMRRFVTPRGLPAVTVALGQVGLGAVVMIVLSPGLATGTVHPRVAPVAAVLALGAIGTGMAYVWNTNIVTHWGATNASTVTYLTPVVGVLLGVLFLGEHLTWSEPVGALLVVAGIAVTQGRLRLP